MAKEFLMLAHNYNPEKHWISGAYISEKLDGTRCLWDGGISRGIPASQIPYANTAKDSRYQVPPIATGLWSRYGHVIHAPDYWLDTLPAVILDGELWMGRGSFQHCRSTVATLVPGPDWRDVKFHCFDCPGTSTLLESRKINNTNFKKTFSGCADWYLSKGGLLHPSLSFESVVPRLQRLLKDSEYGVAHSQERLPLMESKARELVEQILSNLSSAGAEGLMIRSANSIWTPERSHYLLKMKKLHDAEATVVGYTTGRETDKGSKLLGMMGALVTNFNGKRLELSGFTDQERELTGVTFQANELANITARLWASNHPGEECPDWIYNPNFRRGSQVTFQYRELSDAGIPKEGRFHRKCT